MITKGASVSGIAKIAHSWLKAFFTLGLVAGLAACDPTVDLDEPVEPIGDFRLGHNIVVADAPQLGPLSRKASREEWESTLKTAVARRMGRYDGEGLYHLGISVDAYVLALPGVPVVASPKSILIFGVTVWDDAKGGKINEEPHQITVLEHISGESVIGSGLTQSKQKQMENLSNNAARAIEKWLRKNPTWFGLSEDGTSVSATPDQIGEKAAN